MRDLALPDFPWDSLAADKALAEAHPDGIVDLSIGTPVDPVPAVIRAALADRPPRSRATRPRTARPRCAKRSRALCADASG